MRQRRCTLRTMLRSHSTKHMIVMLPYAAASRRRAASGNRLIHVSYYLALANNTCVAYMKFKL